MKGLLPQVNPAMAFLKATLVYCKKGHWAHAVPTFSTPKEFVKYEYNTVLSVYVDYGVYTTRTC